MSFVKKDKLKNFKPFDNHRFPVTRREFLQAGLIEFSAAIAAPSIITLLGQSALADCGAPVPNLPAFIHVNLYGGAAMAANFVGLDKNKALLPSYNLMGLGIPANLPIINKFQGVPFPGNGIGKLLVGLESMATTTTTDKTAFVSFIHRSGDDSIFNELSAVGLINKAGLKGLYLPNLVTRSGTFTGVGQEYAYIRPPAPMYVNNFNDLIGATSFGGVLANLNANQRITLTKLVKDLNSAQARSLASLYDGPTLQTLTECAGIKNLDLITNGTPNIDPRISPIAGVWGLTPNSPLNGQSTIFSALTLNALNGNGGVSCLELGGFDYHDQTRTGGDAKDMEAGVLIGRLLESAAIMQKPLFIHVTTDGSVVSAPSDQPTSVWTSDRGIAGATFTFAYHPTARPATSNNQIGYYTVGQAADDQFIIGNNTALTTAAVFANYLQFAKRMDLVQQVIPGLFTPAQLTQILGFA